MLGWDGTAGSVVLMVWGMPRPQPRAQGRTTDCLVEDEAAHLLVRRPVGGGNAAPSGSRGASRKVMVMATRKGDLGSASRPALGACTLSVSYGVGEDEAETKLKS